MKDIFDFWGGLPGTTHEHPADKEVLSRLTHSFDLRCLITPYRGSLRDAPIVFLFLSPGLHESDLRQAPDTAAQDYYVRMRAGTFQLPSNEEHPSAWKWDERIFKQFDCNHEAVRSKIAFLNICAYKSVKFDAWHMLAALPSSRVCLDWAQGVLFPQAIAGERVVVCLRSANYWGLPTGQRLGQSLYAPQTNRGGNMLHNEIREQTIKAVHNALKL